MATLKRPVMSTNGRRNSTKTLTSRASKSKGKNLTPASFPGKGAIPKTRRTIAKGAAKVNPNLNRELA